MHWEIRAATLAFMFFFSAQIRIETPGLPSGVSSGERVRSIPASQGQPILEVANPVASTAALYAHSGVAAVMMTRESQTGNASAKVSRIFVPLISMAFPPVRIHDTILGYDSSPSGYHSHRPAGSPLPGRQMRSRSSAGPGFLIRTGHNSRHRTRSSPRPVKPEHREDDRADILCI